MADAFVITGSRPPSARSRSRQSHVSYTRPKSGYRKVAESSDADELLFGSDNNSAPSHVHHIDHFQHSTQSSYLHSSKMPGSLWAQPVPVMKEKKQNPLLWSPSNPTSAGSYSSRESNFALKPSHTTMESTKTKYRSMKHTPTYVDETLFGPRLEEPLFDAPWDNRKKSSQPYLFSSTDYTKMTYGGHGSTLEPYSVDGRPPSRQGRRPASTRMRPCTVESVASSTKTVWKP